jgi:Domain of unknown function (DUF4062)
MKIFLSSTYQDLIAHREATARAIERLGQQNVRMEVFGARPLEATSACLEEISDSDALIGLYAHRYGYTPKGQSKSITEQEFDFAMAKKKPSLCFIVTDKCRWPRKYVEKGPGRTDLRKFLQRVRKKVVCDTFTNPEDLAFRVATSLGRFLLEDRLKYEHKIGRFLLEEKYEHIKRPAPRGARLLLVNDISEKTSPVIEILRNLGIDVQVETSSASALRVASKGTYNVVIFNMKRGADRFHKAVQKKGILVPVIITAGRFNLALETPSLTFALCQKMVFDSLGRIRGVSRNRGSASRRLQRQVGPK